MSDAVRAGIIGAGFMGRVHAHAIRAAGGEVTAACASSASSSLTAAATLGAGRTEPNPEALIDATDLDVVHICTPNTTHAAFAERALDTSKHVVCEKPLTTDPETAAHLVRVADRSGKVAAIPFVYRNYAMVREARARIRRGAAGRLHLLHGGYLQDWLADPGQTNWRLARDHGGPSRTFADIGIHWCDLMEFVTGHRITRLLAHSSTVWTERGSDGSTIPVSSDDQVLVLFETDQGAAGSLVLSQVSKGHKNQLRFSFEGTEAAYEFDQETPDRLLEHRVATCTVPRDPAVLSDDSARYSALPPGHPQGYQDSFNSFVSDVYAAIDGSEPPGLPTFADGLRAAELTAAVLESAHNQTWVEVAP